MDAFRRLRSRRKSKEQADSFTSFAEAESSYNTPSSSPWQISTTRSSTTVSRPSDAEKKFSHDQIRQPVSPIESRRSPASTTRIQPLLVGISRPSIGSRPQTSGSFQTALDRAADGVSDQSRILQSSSQLGLRTGRYIDIFAISGKLNKPTTTTFNEDVAERNLDTTALTTEEQHYAYSPSSKYQEEVATRNAFPAVMSRSSSVRRGTNSRQGQDVQDGFLSPPPSIYTRQIRSEADSTKHKQLPDSIAYHSRQSSIRPNNVPEYLPAIPQERSSDDYGSAETAARARIQDAELEMEKAKAYWSQIRHGSPANRNLNTGKPLPTSPYRREPLSDRHTPLRSNPVRRVYNIPEFEATHAPEDLQHEHEPYYDSSQETREVKKHKYDNARSSSYKPDRRSANTAVTNSSEESRLRSDVSMGHTDRQSYTSEGSRYDQPRRPSTTSSFSYKRTVLGNRTIMDLTAEDNTETTSIASYLQTPVVEDARADAFQKAYPIVVDHTTPPPKPIERDSVVPNARWSSALEPVLDLDQLARRSQMISETARAAAVARGQAEAMPLPRVFTPPPPHSGLAFSAIQTITGASPPRTITFSAINTLTSITPRSSNEALTISEFDPHTESDAADKVYPTRGVAAPRMHGAETLNPRISANIAPMVKVFADVQPREANTKTVPGSSRIFQTAPGDSKSSTAMEDSEVVKRNERRREKMARAEAIRIAAKKKIPAGPLDQEPLPGVKTRDFALPPMEKPTNKRIEALSERKRSQPDLKKLPSTSSRSSSAEKKVRGKPGKIANKVTFEEASAASSVLQAEKKNVKKSSKTGSSSRKARPVSSFDEEAFQKKHAEANAALLRLQQSLQQDFDEESSQSEVIRDVNTPISHVGSMEGLASGKSPAARSPSAAAMAMITVAISSPGNKSRPRVITSSSSSSSQMTVKPASLLIGRSGDDLPTLQTTEISSPSSSTLNPWPRVDSNKPPPSPGEVSLSSFPIPTPRTMSPESNKSPPAYVKDVGGPVRRESQSSRVSTSSTFSIPFTMVPNRLGSLPENRNPPPAPPNPHQMQSINAIIPPAR